MRLVALDLDGTLLDPNGIISPEAKEEMERLHGKGVHVAIATGRPYKTVLDILAHNGIKVEFGFPDILVCDEREAYFLRGSGYESWEPWNSRAREMEVSLLPASTEVIHWMALQHESEFLMNNIFMQRDRGFAEIFYWSRQEAEEAFPHFVEKLKGRPIKALRNNRLIALRWREVGKELILAKVANLLGIDPGEILAIGDSHNDMGMLNDFNGATTQNADPEIKDAVRQRGGIIATASHSLGVAEVLATVK